MSDSIPAFTLELPVPPTADATPAPKKRGRKPGSKNKPKIPGLVAPDETTKAPVDAVPPGMVNLGPLPAWDQSDDIDEEAEKRQDSYPDDQNSKEKAAEKAEVILIEKAGPQDAGVHRLLTAFLEKQHQTLAQMNERQIGLESRIKEQVAQSLKAATKEISNTVFEHANKAFKEWDPQYASLVDQAVEDLFRKVSLQLNQRMDSMESLLQRMFDQLMSGAAQAAGDQDFEHMQAIQDEEVVEEEEEEETQPAGEVQKWGRPGKPQEPTVNLGEGTDDDGGEKEEPEPEAPKATVVRVPLEAAKYAKWAELWTAQLAGKAENLTYEKFQVGNVVMGVGLWRQPSGVVFAVHLKDAAGKDHFYPGTDFYGSVKVNDQLYVLVCSE